MKFLPSFKAVKLSRWPQDFTVKEEKNDYVTSHTLSIQELF